MSGPSYSADWTDGDVHALVALCKRVEAAPLDLLACMFNESEARAGAHNPHGDATGLIQFMPATRAGLGHHGTWQEFAALGVGGQLPYVERYFAPHRGRLTSAARVYLCMFLPACLGWRDLGDLTIITSLHGPLAWAYLPNRSLDGDDKGYITLGDLGRCAMRAAKGKRWDELAGRVQAAMREEDGPRCETAPGNDDGDEPPHGPEAA